MNSELLHKNIPAPTTLDPDGVPAIEVKNVTKSFGGNLALNGIDLCVPTGSTYALLGRNAAGKSTLLQLMLGLLEPTSGSISVLGFDTKKDSVEVRKRLGYVPEHLAMYEWMTAAEVLRFVAAQYPTWSIGVQEELVNRLRIPLIQKVRTLSRGQRALLTLVLAMAHDPDLVLLDEATSGLDALAREDFDRSVIDLLHDSGRTVLFASHQINELDRLCDWVGIIHEGRLLVQERVDDLKSRIKTLQVSGGVTELPDFVIPGLTILEKQTLGRDLLLTVRGDASRYDRLPTSVVDVIDLRLEQIFVAIVHNEESRK
jgi:ABC-2 type transport system ATP-binding protein